MKRFVVLALVLACDDGSFYAYVGNEYDPSRNCMDPSSALDVFTGSDPGAGCAVTCLTAPDFDGGVHVYVSTECGPTPPGADVSGTNALCTPALGAFGRDDLCLDGGGSTNPPDASPTDAMLFDAGGDVNTD